MLQRAPFTPSHAFISDGGALPCTNIRRRGDEGFLNPEPYTEDQRSLAYLAMTSRALLERWLSIVPNDAGVLDPELELQTRSFLATFGSV